MELLLSASIGLRNLSDQGFLNLPVQHKLALACKVCVDHVISSTTRQKSLHTFALFEPPLLCPMCRSTFICILYPCSSNNNNRIERSRETRGLPRLHTQIRLKRLPIHPTVKVSYRTTFLPYEKFVIHAYIIFRILLRKAARNP